MNKVEPYFLLEKFISEIPKGEVLDMGSGLGKNSIFLAQNGFKTLAFDIDKNIVKNLQEIAQKEKLNISTETADINNFQFANYSAILALNCLHFLKYSEREKAIEKIKKATANHGLIFISAFTTQDNSYKNFTERKKPIEKNTFYSDTEKRYWNFFEPNELKSYFKDNFTILYYDEKVIKETDISPPQHGIAEIVAKKESVL